MELVILKTEEHVGLLTINRPKALNALNSALLAELSEKLDLIKSSDLRCLIITGSGEKAFIAGADIAEMLKLTPDQAAEFCLAGNAVMKKLEEFPIPVIAAVNGYALGGGCELALSCDIRLASNSASFAFPEVGLGIIPGYGGLQRLARLTGAGRAKELAFTGNRISADQALAIGLVNALCPPEELLNKALTIAEKIAANAPCAVKMAKKTLNESLGCQLGESYGLEKEAFAACFATEDRAAAMTAFVEKTKPKPFKGK